jgi:hypothetical protein
MKKIFNKILIAIAFTALVSSCQKDDLALNNPFVDINNLGKGAYVTLNSTTNVNLNFAAIDASSVGVKIDPYDNGVKIKEVKLYVFKGSSSDPKAWKLVKTVPMAGTTTIAATGAEIAKAYGTTTAALFAPGQFYTFYHQVVTEDGKTYDISNTLGALESAAGYKACMRWTAYVVCPYTSSMAGTYKVLYDEWEDSYPGDIVQITDGPTPNTLNMSAVWPGQSATVVNPLIISINPATGAISLPSAGITFEKYASGTTYLAKNGSGYAFACTGSITFKAQLFQNGTTDFGYYSFSLQKQ